MFPGFLVLLDARRGERRGCRLAFRFVLVVGRVNKGSHTRFQTTLTRLFVLIQETVDNHVITVTHLSIGFESLNGSIFYLDRCISHVYMVY